jgi:hypothetical protein
VASPRRVARPGNSSSTRTRCRGSCQQSTVSVFELLPTCSVQSRKLESRYEVSSSSTSRHRYTEARRRARSRSTQRCRPRSSSSPARQRRGEKLAGRPGMLPPLYEIGGYRPPPSPSNVFVERSFAWGLPNFFATTRRPRYPLGPPSTCGRGHHDNWGRSRGAVASEKYRSGDLGRRRVLPKCLFSKPRCMDDESGSSTAAGLRLLAWPPAIRWQQQWQGLFRAFASGRERAASVFCDDPGVCGGLVTSRLLLLSGRSPAFSLTPVDVGGGFAALRWFFAVLPSG